MPEVPSETFTNPFAPPEQDQGSYKRPNLSNDDFRRLLITPKVTSTNPEAPSTAVIKTNIDKKEEDDRKQKKRSLYSKFKKEEEERQAEWAKKYRDRAKERRDDENPDYNATEETLPSTSTYKAVAPGLVDPSVVAERRKQAIVESKFLGGDIQHTHLVKGLDYVLLDKVRSEMINKEKVAEERTVRELKKEKERVKAESSEDLKFKTTLGRNIYQHCFVKRPATRNELFFPGRMAYVFEMDEEYAESDIPTTLIRSKADCPVLEVTTLTTNDIVINKLTQILSYLRQGVHSGKKGKKKDKGALPAKPLLPITKLLPGADQNIFDDVGEYDFGKSKGKPSVPSQQGKYFTVPESSQVKKSDPSTTEEERTGIANVAEVPPEPSGGTQRGQANNSKSHREGFGFGIGNHYAECYPGGLEEMDGTYDSDEDVDFTKMDMGNKKGPVKRWDFDNEDDYSQYQSKREALPKAAFQYGVKMSEGRKTRRYGGSGPPTGRAKEKAKLDREWQQISAILDKRKNSGRQTSNSKRSKLD